LKHGNKKFSFSVMYHNIWGQWLIPAIITFLVLCIVFAFIPITFMTQDDQYIMECLNGTLTGKPTFFFPFVNIVFAVLISLLYTMTLSINWYMFYYYFVLFLSITTVGYCVFFIGEKRKFHFWKSCLIFGWVIFALFFYSLYTLSFTLTATISCTASMALILTVDPQKDSHKKQIFYYVISIILLFLGFILRPLSAQVVLCFGILGFIYRIIKLHVLTGCFLSRPIRRLLLFLLVIIIILGSISILQSIVAKHYYDFVQSIEARALYMDYPHPSYDNQEMRLVYEGQGMTKEFVELLDHWCFIDKKVTGENFKILSDAAKEFDGHSIKKMVRAGIDLIRYDKFALSMVLVLGFFTLFILNNILQKEKREQYGLEILTILCALGGAFLQCMYLCWTQRFILRSFFSVAIPCNIFVLLLLMEFSDQYFLPFEIFSKGIIKYKFGSAFLILLKKIFCIFTLFLMAVTCYKPIHYAFDSGVQAVRTDILNRDYRFWRYVEKYPENIYICNGLGPYLNPFPKNINLPHNHVFFCHNYEPIFVKQLASQNRDTLYLDALLEENVFLFSDDVMWNGIYSLLIYMCQEYQVPAMKLVEHVGTGQSVYKFSPMIFEKDYTGWMEAYGRHYYLKKGKVQTGWFKVENNTYFGIPPFTIYNKPKGDPKPEQYYTFYNKKIDEEEYIVCTGNSVATGWMYIDNETYFFDSEGVMQTGWAYSEDFGWRYLKPDGKLLHDDWLITENGQYYFDGNGQIYTVAFEGKLDTIPLPQGATVWKGFNSK